MPHWYRLRKQSVDREGDVRMNGGHLGTFHEDNCVVEYCGNTYSAAGGYIMADRNGRLHGRLYVTEKDGKIILSSWDGSRRVFARRTAKWRGGFGCKREHYTFTWEGRKMWGICYSSDNTMVVKVREYKNGGQKT